MFQSENDNMKKAMFDTQMSNFNRYDKARNLDTDFKKTVMKQAMQESFYRGNENVRKTNTERNDSELREKEQILR